MGNIWTGNPYGTYEGPRGSRRQWRQAFTERLSPEEAREILDEDSPWTVLGVKAGASVGEIRAAYRALLIKYHPDHHEEARKEWAAEQFIRVKAAYTVLMARR